jgi:PAS domain S-box-containing protein
LKIWPRPRAAGKRETASRVAELERELAETRDYLQSIQERNEAASEELQASSEEAQSANEELQSINEELETSKEELESANEELTTINDEMVTRNVDLNRLNADLNNLQTSIHTPVLLLARDLTVRRFTPQAGKIFNLLPADVGRGFAGIRHNLEISGLEGLLAEVIDTVGIRESEVRDKDGRWHALRARPYFTLDNKVDGVVLVLTDIDALKRGAQEIKAARNHAEATLRTLPTPFLILDADLRVASASDAFYRAFGVPPAETEGRLIYELGNRQWDIPKLRELLEDILPERNFFDGYEVEHQFESLGRRIMMLNARWLDTEASARGQILLSIEDITARRRGEADVRESEELYRTLFDSVPVAVFVCDRAAVILQYNRRAAALWGREPVRGVETHCGSWRLYRPDGSELPHEQSPIVEVLRTGVPALNVEVSIEQPDYSRVAALANFAALKDARGEITGAVTCFIDITDRKRAEESLRVAMADVERASRAKDDFLAALSHELRTPLTPVLMTAAALEGDPMLPAEVREQLAMMRRNIELEARLIDDLLDITRISRGKLHIAPVAADIHLLLRHTAEIVRSEGLGKQVRIVFALDAARHHAMADPARHQQVFWNLIKNALKFTPTGGTITISTRNDAEGWLLVEVADTGIGIGSEALPHIFNAFEQGDIAGQHRYGGLGLGLAISRAIVEVHGGTIHAESEGPGRGAIFTVALATVDAPLVPPRASVPHSARPRVLRLLIVEDHEATRTVLSRLLTRRGHSVTTASTAREALTAFAAERFDAVISDLGLPDGSGLELMREIQRQRPVPAIALSGYGMEEDIRQTREAGFFAHLVKPVNLDQLRLLLEPLPGMI